MLSKPFPLLVTLTLREFSFELAELEKSEESSYGTLHPQEPMFEMKRSKSQDSITSTQAAVNDFVPGAAAPTPDVWICWHN
jgi:hypothetical protein